MKMKLFSKLKTSLLLAMAIPATCALAQYQGPFESWTPTNATPRVRIFSPQQGALFETNQTIQICADADFFTKPVVSVEFFAGTNELGMVTNNAGYRVRDNDVFCLTVSNLSVGEYVLTAVGTDAGGISATSSVVDITVVTDLPPKVRIFEPRNGALILGPTNIEICASAFDPDGTVATVEFFENSISLGVVSNPPPVFVTNRYGIFPTREPFCLTFSNAAVGAYVLTAVATDNEGTMATSAPVSINVVTDLPPRVHIEAPHNGTTYLAPANIHITADANDPDGTVAGVEFFAGSNSLGVVTTPTRITNSWGQVDSDYSLTLSNALAGAYVLTAVASDNAGLSTTSAPVNITVVPPPPPTVIITQPRNGTTFYHAPVNIFVCSLEKYFVNPVVGVKFLAGTNVIGSTTHAPYSCIVWSNAPAGAYALTAVATDSSSATVTSVPVNITVTTNPPPIRGKGW